ncbi:MAG TPA: response regulator [Clostridiaceae bacterium]|nr:response regulator [Clostridiaceae bacterium]
MRVLVADDESLIRDGLKSMLNELEIPVEVIGEAANGREMVQLVKELKPELVFVDIRMPVINGLDAIEECKKFVPDTYWVVLTGFSEFEFARTAINLGVSYYLMKPVSVEELDKTVRDISQKLKEKALISNKKFESELSLLCHDIVLNEELDTCYGNLLPSYRCATLVIDSHLKEKSKAKRQVGFFNMIRSLIEKSIDSIMKVAFFSLPNGDIAIVISLEGSHEGRISRQADRFLSGLADILKTANDDDFAASILLSEVCHSYETVRKSLNQLQNLSTIRPIIGIGRIVPVNMLKKAFEKSSSELLEVCNTLIKIADAFKNREYFHYMKMVDALEKRLQQVILPDNKVKQNIAGFLSVSMKLSIRADYNAAMLVRSLRSYGESVLSEGVDEDRVNILINRVIDYIEQNYMNDIGLAEIAEILDVTPNYLSSLFHKNMGITFIKYLTKIRMIKAKELLVSSSLQVQQVSEQVGYYSTRHFTKLFKEYYGYYPSDCRKAQC